jgi:hypothetical protein
MSESNTSTLNGQVNPSYVSEGLLEFDSDLPQPTTVSNSSGLLSSVANSLDLSFGLLTNASELPNESSLDPGFVQIGLGFSDLVPVGGESVPTLDTGELELGVNLSSLSNPSSGSGSLSGGIASLQFGLSLSNTNMLTDSVPGLSPTDSGLSQLGITLSMHTEAGRRAVRARAPIQLMSSAFSAATFRHR